MVKDMKQELHTLVRQYAYKDEKFLDKDIYIITEDFISKLEEYINNKEWHAFNAGKRGKIGLSIITDTFEEYKNNV